MDMTMQPLAHVLSASPNPPQVSRLRGWLPFAVGVACLLLWIGVAERRLLWVSRLAPDQRAALYCRTLANLRTLCANPREDAEDFCREQAMIALHLPECDLGCRVQARPHVPRATR
jgi:hypothetical protein